MLIASISPLHLIGSTAIRRVVFSFWEGYTSDNVIDSTKNIQFIEIIAINFSRLSDRAFMGGYTEDFHTLWTNLKIEGTKSPV